MRDCLKTAIPLAIVGCDFRIASTVFRERVLMQPEQRRSLFYAIRKTDPEAGLVVLETCNRVEWIVSARAPDWTASLLSAWMVEKWRRMQNVPVLPQPYRFTGTEAVDHLLRVAAGLESLAEGEAQIAGQFQKALLTAREDGMSSIVLNGLGNAAGRIARAAQRAGVRGNGHHGIHGIVVQAIREACVSQRKRWTVAVLGMGAIGRKTAALTEDILGARVIRYNRTVDPSRNSDWYPLAELTESPPDVRLDIIRSWDALVIATGSHTPLFSLKNLEDTRRPSPLLVLDIGIPRQVDAPDIHVPGVSYRDVDDLAEYRSHASDTASQNAFKRILNAEKARFRRFCLVKDMASLLETIRLRRRAYIEDYIPSIAGERLEHLDPATRKSVENIMKQVIREYANDIFNSIHTALEDFRGADR